MTGALWLELLSYATKAAPIVAMLFSGAIALLILRLRREFATKAELGGQALALAEMRREHASYLASHEREHKALSERLDRGELRFQRLEDRIEAMPTRADLDALKEGVAALAGSLASVQAELRGVSGSVTWVREAVDRLVEHELAEGRSRGAKP
jgi:chromosome segregation ATPase